MKLIMSVLFGVAATTAMAQVQAVYDATTHQQSIINHEAVIVSHNLTRGWLSTILEQIQIDANAMMDCHYETIDQLQELEAKIGKPSTLSVGLTGVAPGQTYGNKTLETLRTAGINTEQLTGRGADLLYGDNAKAGAAERVVEAAYENYESVLEKSTPDKETLLQKREDIVAALPQLTNLAQLAKYQAALMIVDSKLQSLAENETNAALKVLVTKARNEEQRELKKAVQESVEAPMAVAAMQAMGEETEANFESLLQEMKKK